MVATDSFDINVIKNQFRVSENSPFPIGGDWLSSQFFLLLFFLGICLACGDHRVCAKHPLFEGGLCKECKVCVVVTYHIYSNKRPTSN